MTYTAHVTPLRNNADNADQVWTDTVTPKRLTGISWAAAAQVIIAAGTENGVATLGTPAHTSSEAEENLTFTSAALYDDGSAGEGVSALWASQITATAQAAQHVTLANTGGTQFGHAAIVVPGSLGVGDTDTSTAETAHTLTLAAAGSIVIVCTVDWNARDLSTLNPLADTGTPTTILYRRDALTYSVLIAVWDACAAGTFSFGWDTYTPPAGVMRVASTALEVVTALPDPGDPGPDNHTPSALFAHHAHLTSVGSRLTPVR